MKCPDAKDWDLLAVEALQGEQAESMLAHARTCRTCRAQFEAARRDHIDRVRMYEAFDRGHDMLREQLMAALPDEAPRRFGADRLARGWARLGGYVMSLNTTTGRRAIAVLAPAACILIAVAIFLPPGQKSAFAAAIEHLERARTIVCRVTMPEGLKLHGMQFSAQGQLHMSDEYGSHSEMSMNGAVMIRQYAPVTGPMLLIQPMTRTYMEVDASELGFAGMTEQSPDAFVRALFTLTDDAATELGTDTVEEREVIGYRIPGEKLGFPPPRDPEAEEAYAELWVDRETRLPARFLVSMPILAQDTTLKMAYDQFEWDVPLEADLFEPDIPEDYVKLEARLARPTEAALMNALQRIRGLTGGRYPTSFDSISVLAELHPMITKAGMKQLDELGQTGIIELGMEISGGAMYYMKLVRDGHEPEYFGDTVTADDADQVLLRWKLDDGQTRVIYGDLRVETLPAEE